MWTSYICPVVSFFLSFFLSFFVYFFLSFFLSFFLLLLLLLMVGLWNRADHYIFGPLTAEIGSGVWGAPGDFNGFRLLAALLHGSQVVSVSQTLRR